MKLFVPAIIPLALATYKTSGPPSRGLKNAENTNDLCASRIKEGAFFSTLEESDAQNDTSTKDYVYNYDDESEYPGMEIEMKPRAIIILDATGSMSELKNNVINAYNKEIQNFKQEFSDPNFTPRLTLIKFAQFLKIEEYDSIFDVQDLTEDSYQTRGTTALYDAIGCTLNAYQEEYANVVHIMTDGNDNFSKIFMNETDIADKIDDLKLKKDWTIYYSRSVDADSEVADLINVDRKNVRKFRRSGTGINNTFRSTSRKMVRAMKKSMKTAKKRAMQKQILERMKSGGPAPAGFGDY